MRKGFTLLELMTVIALVLIVGAITIPRLLASQGRSELTSQAREMMNLAAKARSLAASGGVQATWSAPTEKVVQSGIQLVSPSRYDLFIDNNLQTDGTEIVTKTITLPNHLQLTGPAEVRFKRTGTLSKPGDVQFKLTNSITGTGRVIKIGYGGQARIAE